MYGRQVEITVATLTLTAVLSILSVRDSRGSAAHPSETLRFFFASDGVR